MTTTHSFLPRDTTELTLPFEPVHTIKRAAEATGLKYWLLLRAVNSGDIPSYQFGNKRRRVRLSDIEAALTPAETGRVK